MQKVYKKLSQSDRLNGIIFTSTLSKYREEMEGDTIHRVRKDDPEKERHIGLLMDDKFFNRSPWRYNIIRR